MFQIQEEVARAIVEALHEHRKAPGPVAFPGPARDEVSARSWFGAWNEAIDDTLFRCRPLIVGVFADQSAAEVNDIADAAKLDLVQLSGGEDDAFLRQIERPVLKAVHVSAGMDGDAVLDAVTRGPQIIVGSSMGAWIMVLTALARPHRVHALLGIASAPDFTEYKRGGGFSHEQMHQLDAAGL